MPIPLTNDERTALRSGAIIIGTLIDVYLDSGRFSFWDGQENFTFDGDVYLAISDFVEIGTISLGTDLGAEGVEIKLNGTKLIEAAPDAGDPGALFGEIESETYQLRRVDIKFAFFNAETGALLFTVRRYAGLIDQLRQIEEITGQMEKVEEWLVMALESIVRRYGVRGGRTRSHEDQQGIWAGDKFFYYTAPAVAKGGTLSWGRKPPSGQKRSWLRDVRGANRLLNPS